MALVGLFFLGLGAMAASYAWYRRDRPEAPGTGTTAVPRMPVAPQFIVGPALGAMCAAFAHRAVTQMVVFLVVAVPLTVAAAVRHVRQRAASRP